MEDQSNFETLINSSTSAIITPISKSSLIAELSLNKLVRTFKGIEVYNLTAADAPNVMDEIGRIRETEFRYYGGGTGKAKDIDQFDIGTIPYHQLIVWDPQEQEIVALYRYILCRDAIRPSGEISLATAKLFAFSQTFKQDYLPYTIELGRSVVNQNAKKRRLGLFVAWSGLGALVSEYPELKYFFGKMTMFPNYNPTARDILLWFLKLYFRDSDDLLQPHNHCQVTINSSTEYLTTLFTGKDYNKDYAKLLQLQREYGEKLPPLWISYLDLTRTMKVFGTACNPNFGAVEETAILLPIADINQDIRNRFIDSYVSVNPDCFYINC